jgi:hypothetical protein
MNKISVPVTSAYVAIVWASQQFGKSGFDVQHQFPSNQYEFIFERPEQANLFALRWM